MLDDQRPAASVSVDSSAACTAAPASACAQPSFLFDSMQSTGATITGADSVFSRVVDHAKGSQAPRTLHQLATCALSGMECDSAADVSADVS